MHPTRKLLSMNFKRYMIPVVLVVAIFFATDYVLVRTIRHQFMDVLEKQLTSFGQMYSHSLAKGGEAYLLINGFLEEKLLSVGRQAASQSENLSDAILQTLAETFSVDEILVYNPEGVIEYATDPRKIGWQIYLGHPTSEFLVSDANFFVDDIRPDGVTHENYKYSYVRADNGYVVQVGMSEDSVQRVLDPFDINRLVSEIASLDLVSHICFVDNDLVITASSDDSVVGQKLDTSHIPEAAFHHGLRSEVGISHHGSDDSVYEVYVPIYTGGERLGTMIISQPLLDAQGMGRTIPILSLIASGAVMVGFLYVMVANFEYNKQLAELAYHEPLTGLPNKAYFEQFLEAHLKDPPKGRHAVLMTHCLNLSVINSVYGFDVGDRVVQELVRRLKPFVNSNCKLFYFATNRFAMFVQDFDSTKKLTALVERIHGALEKPLDTLGVSTRVEAKTGIVELNREISDVTQVFTQALVALHYAEGDVLQDYTLFDGKMAAKLLRQETIAREMREFLSQSAADTMYLVYQPKTDLKSNRIVGFEALARMNSPSLGAVSPVEFIKIAERQDLIIPLGDWVLETACRFLKQMTAAGYSDLHVAVNISGIQLLHERFADRVNEIINQMGIKPHNLELEITESVLIERFSEVKKTLETLREMGIKITIDDFGTGYSSLARMESLPIDSIKIDKYFVDSILANEGRRPIIRDLISMVHNLGLEVVAEGIEQELQRSCLVEWGCDIIQGYLISKPLSEQGALTKLQEI